MARPLLEWQQDALRQYETAGSSGRPPARFLIAAFPGMGKTEVSAAIAAEVGRFTIVTVPQADSLTSWRATLHGRGICAAAKIDGEGAMSQTCASCGKPTRAAVLSNDFAASHPSVIPRLYSKRGPCLLIVDEVHHLRAERAWGVPLSLAQPYIDAVLCLSGTPFRTDEEPVPFVHTEGPWTRDQSPLPEACRISISYSRALSMKPAPLTRAVFQRYDADVSWLENEGQQDEEQRSARLSGKHSKETGRKARRHVLNPAGSWLPLVLADAASTLRDIRETDRRAGGLVVCRDTDHAVAIADQLVAHSMPVAVYTQQYSTRNHRKGNGRCQDHLFCDESCPRAGNETGDILGSYREGDSEWIVTVRKISEGVDVQRLRVLVYATVTRTPLFFVQVLGRVIRVRRDLPPRTDQTAWIYVPDDSEMRSYAEQVEDEIAAAEIAALDDDDEDHGPGGSGGGGTSRDRFVSADGEYSGATFGGKDHDPELMALASELGESPLTTLPLLRKLRSAGRLNLDRQPQDAGPVDPAEQLDDAIKRKDNAARSWASRRLRTGEFKGFAEAISACHRELGREFDVWANNKNVTVEQVEKATQYCRERLREMGNA